MSESPCPDKIDEIMLNTAICLANIRGIIRTSNQNVGYNIQPPALPEHLSNMQYNYKQSGHRLGYCSGDFFLRMSNSPPYTTEKFKEIYNFRDLSVEELQTMYEAIINSENIIKTFMPQTEIIKQMHKEAQTNMKVASDGYMRTVQDKYINELYSAAEEPFQIYKVPIQYGGTSDAQTLKSMARSSLLNPSSFNFRWTHTITYQADYPYQNWRDDIPDIMLRHSECYSNMIKTIIDIKTPERPRQEESILDEPVEPVMTNNTIENEKTEEKILEEINSEMLKIFGNKLKELENETKKNEVRGGNKTRKNKTKKQKRKSKTKKQKRKSKPKTKTRNKNKNKKTKM